MKLIKYYSFVLDVYILYIRLWTGSMQLQVAKATVAMEESYRNRRQCIFNILCVL